MLSLLLILGFTACNLGEIGWPTDSSTNRLFKPLTFTTYNLSTTSVSIAFTKVVDADKYIIEISEDSLQFKKIIRHLSIKADTLKPFLTSSSAVQTVYLSSFTDLNANMLHSARLIAIGKDSTLTSKYSQITLRTLAENIFSRIIVMGNSAIFQWHPTSKVSFFRVTKDASPPENLLKADSVITASEIADTTKIIRGLDAGTYYTTKICYQDGNNVRVRGSITFKTPGTAGSFVCNLKPADVLADSLASYVAANKTNISFVLENGATYNFGAVTIPAGMVRLTFTAPEGVQPTVNVLKFTPSGSMDGFLFENIKMVGSAATTYLFSFGAAIRFTDFTFRNCTVDSYQSVVLFKNIVGCSVDNIVIEKCIVSNNGGYGVLNIGGSSVTAKNIKITNSTFISLGTQLMDIRTKLDNLEVSNCTFYNNSSTNKLAQIFRFADNDHTPGMMLVDKCIFAGNNGATTLKSISSNYPNTASISFGSSYRTADVPVSIATGVGFTDIKVLTLGSLDLFTDPANNNFSIKTSASFDGRGKVGDPRWW